VTVVPISNVLNTFSLFNVWYYIGLYLLTNDWINKYIYIYSHVLCFMFKRRPSTPSMHHAISNASYVRSVSSCLLHGRLSNPPRIGDKSFQFATLRIGNGLPYRVAFPSTLQKSSHDSSFSSSFHYFQFFYQQCLVVTLVIIDTYIVIYISQHTWNINLFKSWVPMFTNLSINSNAQCNVTIDGSKMWFVVGTTDVSLGIQYNIIYCQGLKSESHQTICHSGGIPAYTWLDKTF